VRGDAPTEIDQQRDCLYAYSRPAHGFLHDTRYLEPANEPSWFICCSTRITKAVNYAKCTNLINTNLVMPQDVRRKFRCYNARHQTCACRLPNRDCLSSSCAITSELTWRCASSSMCTASNFSFSAASCARNFSTWRVPYFQCNHLRGVRRRRALRTCSVGVYAIMKRAMHSQLARGESIGKSPLYGLNSLPSTYPWNSGPIQWARGDIGLKPSAARPDMAVRSCVLPGLSHLRVGKRLNNPTPRFNRKSACAGERVRGMRECEGAEKRVMGHTFTSGSRMPCPCGVHPHGHAFWRLGPSLQNAVSLRRTSPHGLCILPLHQKMSRDLRKSVWPRHSTAVCLGDCGSPRFDDDADRGRPTAAVAQPNLTLFR